MSLRTRIIQRIVHINEAIFFYPKLGDFYRKKFQGKRINLLDVGTNKGQSIDFFLGITSANIEAFEPNAKLFSKLQSKYAKAANVCLHNVGIGDIDGEQEFYENVLDESSTFSKLNYDSQYLKRKAKILGVKTQDIVVSNHKVPIITLGGFLAQHRGRFFDVLKIDVEGYEFNVLEGLFNSGLEQYPIRFIQIESHNDDMYLQDNQQNRIEAKLNENGFFRVTEIKHGFGDFIEIIYENTKYEA